MKTIEQPEIVGPVENQYVLFYSGNDWATPNYGIGYAHCDSLSPVDLCADQSGPGVWFWNPDAVPAPPGSNAYAKGPGSLSAVEANCDGESLFAHHGWTNQTWPSPPGGYGSRATFLSGLSFNGSIPQAGDVPSINWVCN